jgi:Orn/Lys/Arg decarboxylase, major domain
MAGMNHSVALLLEALTDYHARDRYGFTPPGHRQGRGADPRTIAAIGNDAFRSDLLATAGLDDRKSSHGYLSHAEKLMADAVGAEQAFFSTCGSSLSVKAAMLAAAAAAATYWSAGTRTNRWWPGSSSAACSHSGSGPGTTNGCTWPTRLRRARSRRPGRSTRTRPAP